MSESEYPSQQKKLPSIYDDPPPGMEVPEHIAIQHGLPRRVSYPIEYGCDARGGRPSGCMVAVCVGFAVLVLLFLLVISTCSGIRPR